jgi:hypothetical protein
LLLLACLAAPSHSAYDLPAAAGCRRDEEAVARAGLSVRPSVRRSGELASDRASERATRANTDNAADVCREDGLPAEARSGRTSVSEEGIRIKNPYRAGALLGPYGCVFYLRAFFFPWPAQKHGRCVRAPRAAIAWVGWCWTPSWLVCRRGSTVGGWGRFCSGGECTPPKSVERCTLGSRQNICSPKSDTWATRENVLTGVGGVKTGSPPPFPANFSTF